MPDIYDPDRGLIISLTDDDYEDYQDGKLSEDFYARRTDGAIANRVDISRLDDDSDDDGEPSDGIDVGSAAIGALIVAAVGGAVYGIKKLWDWGKKKRLEKKAEEAQHHQETGTQIRAATTEIAESVQEERTADKKLLTEDEVNQELMKIIIGMAEIADGKKKVTEAAETLSNAGIIDKATLLERLSDPKTLEGFNAYLEKNLQLVMQNQAVLAGIFGRCLTANGEYVPLTVSDITQQKSKIETIQED